MKYAYINGKILDGTKDMQVKEGFVILTDNDKIEDIVKAGTDLNGYEKIDIRNHNRLVLLRMRRFPERVFAVADSGKRGLSFR